MKLDEFLFCNRSFKSDKILINFSKTYEYGNPSDPKFENNTMEVTKKVKKFASLRKIIDEKFEGNYSNQDQICENN